MLRACLSPKTRPGERGPLGNGQIICSDLERRYRRVLRLLPGWYRQQWEQDMAAAFLDSWLTGDKEADDYISKAAGPGWAEVASVAGLAVRLHLGGPGTPRRYAWGQALRRAVLAVLLVHAVLAVDVLVFLVWSRRLVGWLPAPPGSLVVAPAGIWVTVYYLVCLAWIAIFVTLALGHYRTARVLAALAIVPGLVALLQAQLTGIMPAPFGSWVFWVLVDLAPVLAMTAFHRDAPQQRPPRRHIPTPWLPRKDTDMPFQPPRPLSVLASALAAAGLMLAVAGCSHFRSGLLGHHQPEPTGARLVRIRGRLSHRRCGGVDSAHPAGL